MCGICGVFNHQEGARVEREEVKAMADTLVHRGPDDEGIFLSGPIGLGHRRLSIIDLEGGHQPIANEDETVWVVLNGEIYNFQALREQLLEKGHKFTTHSDTEVIVHLYEEEGENCFSFLRGMFAIAIWDSKNQKLVLARDRVGKKPLFYYCDQKRMLFASEMKAILANPGVSATLDYESFSDYLSLLYVPAPKSIFREIRKVRPGCYLVVSNQGVQEKEFWDVTFSPSENISEKVWCEDLLNCLEEAVRLRLISDVPLGAFLSGGVDSSGVVAMMKEITRDPVVTASIGFQEQEFNELGYARQVASLIGANHFEEVVTPDALAITKKLVWHFDEPFADSSSVPTYYVSKMARQHVTVALSGDGGDESFAGYRRYYFDVQENNVRALFPFVFRRFFFGLLATWYPKADWAPRFLRAKTTFENLACSPIEGYFRSVSTMPLRLKADLLHPDVKAKLGGYQTLSLFEKHYAQAKKQTDDLLSCVQYVDFKTYLPDDILVKVDRASMANSLEVRAPLLDHKFIELAAKIPSSFKLKGKEGKYIFKQALARMLPREILYREKMGFSIPISRWLRKELKPLGEKLLLGSGCSEFLNELAVKKIWQEHQGGWRDHGTNLWTLLMFRLWEEQFLKSSG